MTEVRLLDMGLVPAVRSQTIYHSVARAMGPDSPDTVILVSPSDPYVCVGYHQEAAREVDLERCEEMGLPVFRREVGGGAVYLDRDQVFVQWVVHPERVPGTVEDRYAAFVEPLVAAYRDVGIEAYLRPVNDVHVDGRKIGGTGAALIGNALVLVGSLMFDFDRRAMSEVLRVPSEKMRDKVFESLNEYMVTVSDLVAVSRRAVVEAYLARCSESLGGPLVPGTPTPEEERIADRLDRRFVDPEWLHVTSRRQAPGVKIHEDVQVLEGSHKAPGGLVRMTVRVHAGEIDAVALSGDFTLLPPDALAHIEAAARGPLEELGERVEAVYRERRVEAPGLGPGELSGALTAVVAGQT